MERVGTKKQKQQQKQQQQKQQEQQQELQQEQPQQQQQKVKPVARRKGNSKANIKSRHKATLPTSTTNTTYTTSTTPPNVGYSNVKQRISTGVASMNNMSIVFQRLFDTLEAEHVKLQALESRRVRLTEEMHVLHEMLKKQNQQLRNAEKQEADRMKGDKNRVSITQMPAAGATVPKPSGIVKRSPSLASASSRRRGSAAAKSGSTAKAGTGIVKNAGTAGILSKSGSKIPKTFALNSPSSKTTTFTVVSPPSQPGSAIRLKTPAGGRAARRSSIVSFNSGTNKVTGILSKSIAGKASKVNAVGKPFTMVKSIKINDPSQVSVEAEKPSVMPKSNLKVPPKPAIKKGFKIKQSGENIAMAGARLLGINKLVKSIIALPRTTPPPPPPPPPFTTLGGMTLPPFATPITPNRKDSDVPARAVAPAAAASESTTSTGETNTDAPVIDTIVTPQTSNNAVEPLPQSTSITSDQQSPGTILKRSAHSENFTGKQEKRKRSKVNVGGGSPPKTPTPTQQQSSVHIIEQPRKLPETSSLQLEVSTPPTEQIIIPEKPTRSSDAKVTPLPKESKRKVPQLDASQTQQDEAPQTKETEEPELKESRNPKSEDSA